MNATFLITRSILNLTSRAIPLPVSTFILYVFVPELILSIVILGILGFIGNAITFLQPELRSNTCCIYTFCSSIVDIIHIIANIFPDYLKSKFGVSYSWGWSIHACRIYYFFYSFLPQLAINFLILSIIDRYACTCQLSSRLHRLNDMKMAPRMIAAAIVISALLSIYAPTMSAVNSIACYTSIRRPYAICNIVINGIMQPVIMLIFVLLTYRNVLLSRKRVGHVRATNVNRSRNQFMAMIITQVMVTAMFSLQWLSGQMYVLFTTISAYDIDGFLQAMVLLSLTVTFYGLNNVKSFYFSMMTSQVYRQTFVKGLKRLIRRR